MTSTPPPPLSPIDDALPAYTRHKESEEGSPEYPLEEVARGRPPLDAAAVEASAPKPRPPRWWQFWRFSKRAKIIMVVAVLALVGLVAAMIWFGVHRAKERRDNPADLSVARNMVEPEVFTSLVSYDGDLLTPFEFSPPTISNRSFYFSSSNTVNATILTSSSQLLQLPTSSSSSSYFVKIFGNRSTDIVFAASPENSTATDWTAQVSAFWKVSPGGNQEERDQWGLDQLSKTVGGSYGYKVDSTQGDSAVGLALDNFGNDTFDNYYSVGSSPDKWLDSSMIFNVKIFLPPRSYARRLEVFSTSAGDLNFNDLQNSTFDLLDARLPLGWMATSSYWPVKTRLLNVFTGQGIIGSYILASGTLLSHGTIQPILAFPPTTVPSASAPYNLTLISTNGYVQANITSISLSASYSSSPGINLDVTTLSPHSLYSGGIKVFLPLYSFNGSFELATNNGAATAVKADGPYSGGGIGWESWGGRRGFANGIGQGQKKVEEKISESGKGRIRLNSEAGDVGLSIGPGNFAMI